MKKGPIYFILFLFSQTTIAQLDIQGHRGCRGLMPENSIEGFLHALDLGVTTLEMDVVITKDRKVVLSHEPYISNTICLDKDGTVFKKHNKKQVNIFQMTYKEVMQYDCGLKAHPGFPIQAKKAMHKPLLSDVIDAVEKYINSHSLNKVDYNIEIKSMPQSDGIFHPPVDEFAKLLLKVITEKQIKDRCIIQSFDIRALQATHAQSPDITTALLIHFGRNFKKQIKRLGFQPDIYSPNFKLVNKRLVRYMKQKGIKITPWTANAIEDIHHLLKLNVDGIISDYPDRVKYCLEGTVNN